MNLDIVGTNFMLLFRKNIFENVLHTRKQILKKLCWILWKAIVLVAIDDFISSEKLWIHFREPRKILKALNNYNFQAEDLYTEEHNGIFDSRLA